MEVRAIQKFVRMSPRKLRLVASLVKNLPPSKVIETLPFVGKRAAYPLSKVIKAAIANAKEKKLNVGDLVFKEIQINEGPRIKGWRPGARGRVKPYQRRMSHIRVILETKEPEAIREARESLVTQKPKEDSKTQKMKGGSAQKNQRKLAKKSA